MSKKPLSRSELKRLEQLQKQLEIKESKLNAQEAKLKKQHKDLESDQRKLATARKQFNNEKKQFKVDKDASAKHSKLNRPQSRGDRPFSANKSRKLKEDHAQLKKKHEHFAKLMRDYKKKADQLAAENKVLKKRVANANNKKLPTNDKQLRGLMKENRWLKKKLRELMKDLAKQKRWYARVVKVFKDNNNKWVQKKIEAYKDKEYIIKYIFLDDIKRITLTRPGHDRNGFKPRVRIKNSRGGQVVLRNVGIDVFDQKVRKRDRQGKRDRRGGNGGKGRNSKDVIIKQRPGKDGKNIIKTKYNDKGDIDTVTKEKAGKKGNKSGSKNATPTGDSGSNGSRKGKKSGGSGNGSGSDGDGSGTNNDNGANGADPITSEFLKAEPTEDNTENKDIDDIEDGGPSLEDEDGKEINEDEWDTIPDPQDELDDYMIEFMQELGINITKDDLDNLEEKLDDGDDAETDPDEEDAKLDQQFADALKTDKDLMFDGDDAGSPEMQAQIMYMIGEMDSRNDDLRQLKNIADGVQYIGQGDSGGNEEEVEEKELKTTKDKLDAMEIIFASMQKRQETFLNQLEELNCDTDAMRDINNAWYDQYHTLAKMALTGGGAGGDNAKKHLDKLRYFIDYFMKELIGRMYDLRCVNAAYYNQGIDSIPKAQNDEEDPEEAKLAEDDDRPVFEILQSGIDTRHNDIQEIVSNDEVYSQDNSESNSEDKVSQDIENVLNDFLGNNDDWKSLIEETKQKHTQWIEKRGNLFNALSIRHAEIGEIMDKINHVPSYSINLQKYIKEEIENDNIMSDDADADENNDNDNDNGNDEAQDVDIDTNEDGGDE